MVCYATQKEAEESISQINKGTEQHAEIFQKRYAELKEGKNKNKKDSNNNGENQRSERQNFQNRKGADKWLEEMDILKCNMSQIIEYTK